MAEMYNYWCPYCGQGYSVGKFDLQNFQCPKPDCKLKANGIGIAISGKAVVVPKIGKVPDAESPFTFKDMRFSEIGTKKIIITGSDDNDNSEELSGVEKIDEREINTGKGAKKTRRRKRKNNKTEDQDNQ